MEILGIGPGEFVFILVILLVVVGPERLPDLARKAGGLLVRARNWIQSSPDAAMVIRARQELEQEIVNLRASLREVQSVRDEVMGAARQIEESVESFTSAARTELNDIGSIAPPNLASPPVSENTPLAEFDPDPMAEPPAELFDPTPNMQPGAFAVAEHRPIHTNTPLALPAFAVEHTRLETIDLRLQAIMSDLFALQEQLRKHNVLDDDWQPPSWGVQLPDHSAPAVAAEEASS